MLLSEIFRTCCWSLGFCYLKHGAKTYVPSAGRISALTKPPDRSAGASKSPLRNVTASSTGSGNLTCARLQNTDISGPNLGYEGPGKKVEDCCGGCEKYEGCKAAVHFEYAACLSIALTLLLQLWAYSYLPYLFDAMSLSLGSVPLEVRGAFATTKHTTSKFQTKRDPLHLSQASHNRRRRRRRHRLSRLELKQRGSSRADPHPQTCSRTRRMPLTLRNGRRRRTRASTQLQIARRSTSLRSK